MDPIELIICENTNNNIKYFDNGDVVLFSLSNLGKTIVNKTFDIEHDKEIDFDRLYDLVEEYMNDVVCLVLDSCIQYCENNDVTVHM